MTDFLNLLAESRTSSGTGPSRALRRSGMIPCIIYGAEKKPISISIQEKEITKYYRKPQFISQPMILEVGKSKYKVLPKAVQLNPVTDIVSHVDFIFLGKKEQKMKVPIVYSNKETCLGVKRGGYFNIVKRTANLLCSVNKLPRKIEIDVSKMSIASNIKLGQLSIAEGCKLLDNPELVIASIIGRKGKNEDDTSPEDEKEEESK